MTESDRVGKSIQKLQLKFQGFFIFSASLREALAGNTKKMECLAAYSLCESFFFIHQDVYHDLFVCS